MSALNLTQKLAAMYDLETLEREIKEITETVQLAFYEIGKRLKIIQSEKLYELKGYSDFKEYVFEELNIARSSAYRQIDAARVLDDIEPVMQRVPLGGTREKYLRPLTLKSLSAEDRRNIWQMVEKNIADSTNLSGEIVKKTVFEYRTRPQLPPVAPNTVCKVRIKGSLMKRWDGRLVRVIESFETSAKCEGFWGEEIKDHFFLEELIPQTLEDNYRYTVNLPIEAWEKLRSIANSPEKAILLLLDTEK